MNSLMVSLQEVQIFFGLTFLKHFFQKSIIQNTFSFLGILELKYKVIIDIYLGIDKAYVIFSELFTNFPYLQITTK